MDNKDKESNSDRKYRLSLKIWLALRENCFFKFDVKDIFKSIIDFNDSLFDKYLLKHDVKLDDLDNRNSSKIGSDKKIADIKKFLSLFSGKINIEESGKVQIETSFPNRNNDSDVLEQGVTVNADNFGEVKLSQILEVKGNNGSNNRYASVSFTFCFCNESQNVDSGVNRDLLKGDDISPNIDTRTSSEKNSETEKEPEIHTLGGDTGENNTTDNNSSYSPFSGSKNSIETQSGLNISSDAVSGNRTEHVFDEDCRKSENKNSVSNKNSEIINDETAGSDKKSVSEDLPVPVAGEENAKSENNNSVSDKKTEFMNDDATAGSEKNVVSPEKMTELAGMKKERSVSDEHSSEDTKLSPNISPLSADDGKTTADQGKAADLQQKVKVRPNPRTLWKNLPVPPDIPFYKDSSDSDCLPVSGDLKIFGASQRGRSHAHIGKPRDDDFRIAKTQKEDWYVLIVADGAGSAKYSRQGSRIACETLSRELTGKLSRSDDPFNTELKKIVLTKQKLEVSDLKDIKILSYSHLLPLVKKALSEIETVAKNCTYEQTDLKDFSTTLLFVIVRKFGDSYLVVSFSIGDGAIVVYDKDEDNPGRRIVRDGKSVYTSNTLLMNTPDSGEYAGQTRFLTMKSLFMAPDLINRISVHFVKNFTSIMLMTDGVSDAKFETEECMTSKENWDEFWKDLTEKGGDDSPAINLTNSPESLKGELLEWLNYWAVGNHDDRTLVVMYRNE
jgi:serine/threonine protein phosphatase PrpC